MMTATLTRAVAGISVLALLLGCEREVTLQGARFDARTPIEQVMAADAVPQAAADNRVQPIRLPAAQNLAEWSQQGGNARHSLPHGSLSAAPALIWSARISAGSGRGARISAAPIVVGQRVFAMDQGNQVTALTTATGAVLWQADIHPEFDGSQISGGGIAAGAGRVFAATGYGEVIALSADSGAVIWRQRLAAPAAGAPTVDGNAVYVMARDGSAMAMDAGNGRILWQNQGLGKVAGVLGAGTAASDGRTVYLPFAGGQIAGLDREGGTVWLGAVAGKRMGSAYTGFGDISGEPVIADGVLYVGTSAGRTVALDAQTGTRIWSVPEGAMNAPLVVGGSVFVVNDRARLVRLAAATGEVIWGQQMPYFTKDNPKRQKAITAHFGPVLAGGYLVIASGDGALRLFDPASGQITGQADIPSGAASSPALAGGMLFVLGQNGQLHAFR